MTSVTGLDVFVSVVDLTVILVAIVLLGYCIFRGYHRGQGATGRQLGDGAMLLTIGLAMIVLVTLGEFVYRLTRSDGINSLTSSFYSIACYDWVLSRVAFAAIAVGFVLMVLNRQRNETDLRSSIDELEHLNTVGREAEERFRVLLNNSSSAIYAIEFDPPMSTDLPLDEQVAESFDATLSHCNAMFTREFPDSTAAEIIGRRLGSLNRGFAASTHVDNFRAFVKNGYRLDAYEFDYRTPDGQERSLSANAEGIVKDGFLERVWVVENNVLELRDTKVALERRQAFLEVIAWVSSQMVTATDARADELVETCIGEVCRYLSAGRLRIFWFDDHDSDVASVAYAWSLREQSDDTVVFLDRFPAIVSRLRTRKTVQIDDVSTASAAFAVDRAGMQSDGVTALLVLPMVVADRVVGGMSIDRFEQCMPWSDDDLQDAVVLSELLANFVLQLRSRRALKGALTDLQRATDRLKAENVYLRKEVDPKHGFTEIIGESGAILRSLQLVEQVAGTKTPVLVLGETGTGKELIARAIHNRSDRCDKSLIKVNCAALPANLIESELFGHEKGAFTGADSSKQGRFELANGSTLFLDEVGEIPVELQSKLLRVLQEGEFDRLGGTRTIKVDVRIVIATNRDLEAAVEKGEFRSDLYYRINTFPITLPPLRDRGSDIDMLAKYFVRLHAERLDRDVQEISAEMMRQLRTYSWPGNVRELEGIIQRALISTDSPILDLVAPLVPSIFDDGTPRIVSSSIAELKLVEREHIVAVLDETQWKVSGKSGAASRLGIPPSTLRSKMKKLKIVRPD